MSDVAVVARSESFPNDRATRTGVDGTWALAEMQAGTWDVTFSLAGHQSLTARVKVRSGELSRLDAEMVESAEEEAVYSTATRLTLFGRPAAVWRIESEVAEALPLGHSAARWLVLAPRVRDGESTVDELRRRQLPRVPVEGIDSMSTLFAGSSVELTNRDADPIDLTTSAPRELAGLFRETRNWGEGEASSRHAATVGGRWSLAALAVEDGGVRDAYGRTSIAVTARDTVQLSLLYSSRDREWGGARWLHTRELSTIAAALATDYAAIRSSRFIAGAHEVAGGVERLSGVTSGFIRDRWHATDRVTVEGGLRLEGGDARPRLGATIDPSGDGRIGLSVNLGKDDWMLAGAMRIGAAGYARVTLLRDEDGGDAAIIDGDAQWLMFHFGGSATLPTNGDAARAVGWVLAHPPLAGQDVSIGLLQHVNEDDAATGLAIRYALLRERFTPFAEADVEDLFGDQRYRASVGLRWR